MSKEEIILLSIVIFIAMTLMWYLKDILKVGKLMEEKRENKNKRNR